MAVTHRNAVSSFEFQIRVKRPSLRVGIGWAGRNQGRSLTAEGPRGVAATVTATLPRKLIRPPVYIPPQLALVGEAGDENPACLRLPGCLDGKWRSSLMD